MTRKLLPVLLLGLLTAPLAGCVELDEGPDSSPTSSPTASNASATSSSAPAPSAAPGTMTAKHATSATSGPCPTSGNPPFCATRTHWIDGALDLERIPVDLQAFNGNIHVKGGSAGAWNLTVVLSARGSSAEAARTALDNIEFTWSHETSGGHQIQARAVKKSQQVNNNEAATMTLIVPAAVLLSAKAATSNADLVAQGIRGDSVDLATSNGRVALIDAEMESVKLRSSNAGAEVRTVSAKTIDVATSNADVVVAANARDLKVATSNGGVDVQFRPTANGQLTVTNSNGEVTVKVPEDASHGYDLSAVTSNGDVSIDLKDGSASGSATSKTFKTSNYASRSIQTKAQVVSSNDDVGVSPL